MNDADTDSRIRFIGLTPDAEIRESVFQMTEDILALAPTNAQIEVYIINVGFKLDGSIRILSDIGCFEVHDSHGSLENLMTSLRSRAFDRLLKWILRGE